VDTIIFRCDAGHGMGGGHVKRCVSLGRSLENRGWTCYYVSNEAARTIDPFVAKRTLAMPAPEEKVAGPTLLDQARARLADRIVLDHPELDASDEASLAAAGLACLSFVDDVDRGFHADALIAPGLAARAEAIRPRAGPGCLIMAGPGFAPLDAAYRQAAAEDGAARDADAPWRILVSFGMSDPTRAGDAALAALGTVARPGRPLRVDYVVGRMAAEETVPKPPDHLDLRIHRAPETLAPLLADCDLAIGAAGTTTVERCALGVPAVVVPVADNQAANAALLRQHGAARVVAASPAAIAEAVEALLCRPSERRAMARAAGRLADCFGADRIAADLIDHRDADRRRISLRRADSSDRERLFEWQRDPEMRRFAHTPRPPSWSEHVAWTDAVLADRGRCLNIVEADGTAAGFVRLDRAERGNRRGWLVSIGTAPTHRGRGVARQALGLARIMMEREPLFADVHPDNAVSRRLFESAGYTAADYGFLQAP